MNKRISGLILILVVLVMVPLHGYAATPKETVETGVNKLLKTLGDPAFKAKPEDERIAIIGAEIETVFDFKELSRRTLGREWKKMKTEQQKEFVQLFKELLQGVYADRLLAYSDQKITFEKETTRNH
jgi:phospholipid transport system substrate-binding protein